MKKSQKDDERNLLSRIAWLYHEKKFTQADIAERLSLSRMKVQRLLSKSRKAGIVEIRINSPITSCFSKEIELIERFGLLDARVIQTPEDEQQYKTLLGEAAAKYLVKKVKDGQVIGGGWGTTLRETTKFVSSRDLENCRVVSLIGDWTRRASESPYEVSGRLAVALNAQCFNISAPIVADSVESRRIIVSEKIISQTIEMAKHADVALIGIGNAAASNTATLIQAGYISIEEVQHFREMGAVGDILGYFYDSNGQPVHSTFNDRVIGIRLEDLRRIAMVIGVAGSTEKAHAILGAIKGKYVNVLITDENAAARILSLNLKDD